MKLAIVVAIVPEVVIYPAASGAKGDRLLAVKKEEVALTASAAANIEPKQTTETAVSTPAPQAKPKSKEPTLIPRHWHDNAASGYTIRKRSKIRVSHGPIERGTSG